VEIVCSIQPYGYLINEVISFENCTKGELLTTSFDAVDLDIKSVTTLKLLLLPPLIIPAYDFFCNPDGGLMEWYIKNRFKR